MIVHSQLMDEIRRLLSIFALDIKQKVQVNRMEDNISGENIGAGLLNLIYDYDLKNANAIHQNQKGIDLFDPKANDGSGVAVQVTSSNTRQKVIRTMKAFTEGEEFQRLCDEYASLVVLILTMDEKFPKWDQIHGNDDYKLSILSLMDLSRTIEEKDTPTLQKIHDYLVQELGDVASTGISDRDMVSAVAQILDMEALSAAKANCTDLDLDRFYLVDTNFQLMLRVVSSGGDVIHEDINKRLAEILSIGAPAILTGNSGCGKSTIMLRAAVEWVQQGYIALWIQFSETSPITDKAAKDFYNSLLKIIPDGKKVLLCLDNPSEHADSFRALAKYWPDKSSIQLMLAERSIYLSRLADSSSDYLHHWFDHAEVVAMRSEHMAFRLKDYQISYLPDDKFRKEQILKKVIPVLVRRGGANIENQDSTVHALLADYGKNSISLVELIYLAQFRLRDFAPNPANLRMDWDEWKTLLRNELGCKRNARDLYGVIALSSVFGTPMTVDLFCRMFDLDRYDLLQAIQSWRINRSAALVLYDANADALLPRHDVAAELFFLFHRENLDHNAMMEKVITSMEPWELETLLEKMVFKKSVQGGFRGNLKGINYRRLFMTIYDRKDCLCTEGRTRLGLGLLYTVSMQDRAGQGRKILEYLEKLDISIAQDQLTASYYTEWGILISWHNNDQLAEKTFRMVIEHCPSHIPARTELGRLLTKLGRDDEAEALLWEALNIEPTNIQARTELGRLLMKLGRYEEAESELRRILFIDPNNIHARTELGRLLMKLGRDKEAESELRHILVIDPNNIQARTELGRFLAKLGRYEEAETVLRNVITIAPNNIYSRITLGHLLNKLGRSNEAMHVYQEVLALDPTNAYARNAVARIEDNSSGQQKPSITPQQPSSIADPTPDDLTDQPDEEMDLEEAARELNELKIIFLGDGEAGKTRTISRLVNGGENPQNFDGSATPGIDISTLERTIGDKTVKVNIWDFGGQEIFHSMHRMFLTGKALYVVVLNAREDNMNSRARYWLQSLKTFFPNPPVLLVLNKIDENEKASVNESELRRLYPELKDVIKLSALKFTAKEFNQAFTDILFDQINQIPCFRDSLSPSQHKVREFIRTMSTNYLTYGDYDAVCTQFDVEEDPDMRNMLLEILQDLGLCFSYINESNQEQFILKPNWITNAIYMLMSNIHEDLNNGILGMDSICTLLAKTDDPEKPIHRILPGVTYTPEEVSHVLNIIRKFQLSYKLDEENEFFPMLCPAETPGILGAYDGDKKATYLFIEYEHLPTNLIHSLMVENRAELNREAVWYSGAQFINSRCNSRAVVKSTDNTLEIYIQNDVLSNVHQPMVYLRSLLSKIEEISTSLSLRPKRKWILYKEHDSIHRTEYNDDQYFDYDNLVKGLKRGTTMVYSDVYDKSIPVAEIISPGSSVDPDRQQLILDIASACRGLQRNYRYHEWNENGLNSYVRDILSTRDYFVQDQTLAGTGDTGYSDGELDLRIYKPGSKDQPWTICEALCLSQKTGKKYWEDHLKKLIIDYNLEGLPFLIQLCYVKSTPDDYKKLISKYFNYLENYAPEGYVLHDIIPLETVPHQYEENHTIFGADCRYVQPGQDTIQFKTVCHIFVCMDTTQTGDTKS